jgi:cytochrome b5
MSEQKKKEYTLEEIAKHNTQESCWLIIGNLNNGTFCSTLAIPHCVTWSIVSGFSNSTSTIFLCMVFSLLLYDVHNILYTIIGGPKVYDVTKYLDDHPGGAEVMLDVAGQDADEFFEDIGHSNDAREELKKYYIGDYKIDEAALAKMKADAEKAASKGSGFSSTLIMMLVALLAIAFGYYKTQM